MKARVTGVMVVSTLALTLAGCGTAEKRMQDQGYAPLTQTELEQMHARTRTMSWSNPAGSSGTVSYEADGAAEVNWSGGTDTGRWRIDEGQFCIQWQTIRNGVENCTRLYRAGDNEYRVYNMDGTLNSTVTFTN